KKMIGVSEIDQVVAKMARVPLQKVSASDKDVLRHLERDLKLMIYGQDQAIGVLADAIKLARSGLRDGQKPVGCFLFSGPTGVGKTEVTRQLARIMGIELLRFDMSEYMEKHSVSRLIGAPPGYVGFDQGGLLTEAVTKHPHAVLLLDEIEKAHPDVFNILLQVMDHGALTDTNGRKADFRHVILIMTTNLGAAEMERGSIGFAEQDHGSDSLAVIKRQLSPEFRNRLDAIIQFAPLELATIELVVDKFLVELETQISTKGVQLDIDASACLWLAKHGYDKTMGARPMARLIEEKVKKPLANELLFGDLVKGGKLHIFAKDDELIVEVRQLQDVCE
nr:AAA domain-containing protein [Legionellales bacterium]